ncbi:Quino protein amine dehydrogenase [Dipodascopsis tothii]|uniref:Quino protein amine dehydrogenase n=1 Tax=Dipodascopsis tothii TaxID=44089 RepID=UPI0034D01B57
MDEMLRTRIHVAEVAADASFLRYYQELINDEAMLSDIGDERWANAGVSLIDLDQLHDFEVGIDFGQFLADLRRQRVIDLQTFFELRELKRPAQVTARDMRAAGHDAQAIRWPAGGDVLARARRRRLDTYSGYINVPGSQAQLAEVVDSQFTDERIFSFATTFTEARPSLLHFQLRNLVFPLSKACTLYSDKTTVKRLNADDGTIATVFSQQKCKTSFGRSLKISTIAAAGQHLIVGGLLGQFAYKRLDSVDTLAPQAEGMITFDVNGITNHADIVAQTRSGGVAAVFSSNDRYLRTLDLASATFVASHAFDFAINCTAASPGGKRRLVVGDALDTLVIDADSGRTLATLAGHKDYSFACAWSPDDRLLATGNQDKTCRIYDARNLSTPLHVVGAQLGAVRSLKFNHSGAFLALAEPIDYVHVIDTRTVGQRGQLLEFWGGVAGVGFCGSDDDDSLWVGNSDPLVGGLMRFTRNARTRGRSLAMHPEDAAMPHTQDRPYLVEDVVL